MDPGSRSTGIATSTMEAELSAIVTPVRVRVAGPGDRVAGLQPQLVVEPANELEVAKVLKFANDAGLAVIPRGGGTKLEWGNAPRRADVVLSTKRINNVVEHAWADLTVTVEAGCTILQLAETLGQRGQRLALDVLWPEEATVGGVLSTNDSGSRRLRFGSLRDLVIGMTLALPDGTLAKSGGKVVKNVAGYDLPKLATGALGTLGVITRAVFRLHPAPRFGKSLSFQVQSPEQVQGLFSAVQNSKLAHTSLQVRVASDSRAEVDIVLEGTEAGVNAQEKQLLALVGAPYAPPFPAKIWIARTDLWSNPDTVGAIARISVLPAAISAAIQFFDHVAKPREIRWRAVLQATGLGCVRIDGPPESQREMFEELRAHLQRSGGSVVILRRPEGMGSLDAWGDAGDALPLMRAVKQQFDPKNTLNPGRFVGGI